MGIKKRLGRIISRQKVLGFIDFLNYSKFKNPWGSEFNGQHIRKKIFEAIFETTQFKVIVETGTYRGTTTSFFSKFHIPVYTGEYSPRYYSFSKFRFITKQNVRLYNADSRIFLKQLAKENSLTGKLTFFI